MFSIVFEFFNFKKHPKHLWLFFSLLPFLVILIGVVLEEFFRINLNISKDFLDYIFFVVAPINLIGVGLYIYSLFTSYPLFFKSLGFHKVMLYIFLVATFINTIWMLWVQVDTFRCHKFLCELFVFIPLGIIIIITGLLLIYSLVIFGSIKKDQLNEANPYL